MIHSTAERKRFVRWATLIAALALCFAMIPSALAATTVRLTLRSSITLGLTAGRNDTATLSATVKTTDGSPAPAITWKSSATAVVSVDASGKLTASKLGTAVVRATSGSTSALCKVTVRRLPVQALTLNKRRLTLLSKRDGYQLTSAPVPGNADNPSVTWSSSNTGVALVDRLTGYVTPLKPGTAVIQCRAADGTKKKSYCTVVVKPVLPAMLTMSQTALQVNVGAATNLSATISPADATDKHVTWSSSNPSVATISGGVVTGRKFGKATITARSRAGSVKAQCAVSVGYYTTTFRALIVGQDTYFSGDLDAPAIDVKLINSMLLNSDFGGGKKANVTLRENLSTAALLSELNAMASWGVDSDDVTYFYYSGHGSYDDPGALVGVDGGTVPVDEVRRCLDKLPGTVVVILDSCYAGWYIRGKSAGAPSAASVDTDAVANRVVSAFNAAGTGAGLSAKTSLAASHTALGKYKILAACSSKESSYIIGSDLYQGSSLFTYYLTTGGGVRAADWEVGRLYADANHNNIVTLDELFHYAQPRVASNSVLRKAHVKQSVRVWPAGSSFPVVQRTP
jgi:uncharacterized protein YjdB